MINLSAKNIEMDADFARKLTALFEKSDFKYPVLETIDEDILALSFLFHKTREPVYIQKMLEICLEGGAGNNQLDVFQKNHVYWQCISQIFVNNCSNNGLELLLHKVFQKQVCAFQNMLPPKYNFIPKEKRNKKSAVVITNQFLDIKHSPSNVVLNVCLDLIKDMNMAVCLINSAESLPSVGEVSIYNKNRPTFIEEFNDINVLNYKDTLINFYQCRQPMPNLREIETILDFITELKPYFIANIGDPNITADLCSAIVPVITYPLLLRNIPITTSQFSIFRGKLTVDDIAFLRNVGKTKDNIIDNVNIPIEVPEPKNIYSRTQFNMPEDKFIVVIAGNRLDSDISDEVISFFRELIKNDKIHIAIIGDFNKYNDYCAKYNDFSTKSTYLGYQADYMGVITLCDLYINPKRQGNGALGVWAAFKGLPIVTFAHNDVADTLNNEEFYVNSYDEMKNVVYQYISDTQFYKNMSIKAQKIAEARYQKKYTKQIIEEMVSRSIFV